MLLPPPRTVTGVESTISQRPLPESLNIDAPDGIWKAHDVVHIPTPLPHSSDAAPLLVNPLASNSLHPGTHTAGPPLVAIPSDPIDTSAFLMPSADQPGLQSLYAQLHIGVPGQVYNHKPRNSLMRNKSSYLSRTVFFERFENRLQPPSKDTSTASSQQRDAGATGVAVGRGITLLESSPSSEYRAEPLARVLFTQAWPLKTALNRTTRSSGLIDLALGMSTGDVIWCELSSQRYSRLNKAGSVSGAAVTSLTWVPGSSNLVAVGHCDGRFVIYNVEKDDAPPMTPALIAAAATSFATASSSAETFTRLHSLYEPHPSGIEAAYELSTAAITAIAFASPKLAALASRDGYIRLLNLEVEQVTDVFPSLFAGILCAAFSPDGRYLAYGGEDDLVTIIEIATKTVVARLVGHRAWVRRVVWDFATCDCEAREYRAITIAEDGQLMFYEFLPRTLPPPLQSSVDAAKATHSVGATTVHAVTPLGLCPRLRPLAQVQPTTDGAKALPLCDIILGETYLQVSSSDGRVWTWLRPQAAGNSNII